MTAWTGSRACTAAARGCCTRSSPRAAGAAAAAACVLSLWAGAATGDEGFLVQLLGRSAHPIGDGSLCLTDPASVGGEIAAIMTHLGADETDLALTSSCQDEADRTAFCTLSFATTGDEAASAGFVFRTRPPDRTIDLATVACFQTP